MMSERETRELEKKIREGCAELLAYYADEAKRRQRRKTTSFTFTVNADKGGKR